MFELTPLELIADARVPLGLGGHWYGVFPALVSDIKDPDGQGRVKITLPNPDRLFKPGMPADGFLENPP